MIAAAILAISLLALGACGGSDSNSSEKNKVTVSRFVEEFKNKANHQIVNQLFSENFVHHLKDPRLPPGREAMILLGQSVAAGFPDVHATVEELLAEGDKVVERTTARGTHLGVFNGIPPTGREVTWTEMHIYRIDQGKIAELWSEIDFLGLLVQLGAIPSP